MSFWLYSWELQYRQREIRGKAKENNNGKVHYKNINYKKDNTKETLANMNYEALKNIGSKLNLMVDNYIDYDENKFLEALKILIELEKQFDKI